MRLLVLILTLFFNQLLFAQKLIIGTLAFYPPFVTLADKQHFYGFDIDIMQEICKRLQTECTFKAIQFSELFPSLAAKKIDLAVAGITITPERSASYLFSLPYLTSGAQFMTKASSALNNLEDIKGKKVGVVLGTIFSATVHDLFKESVTTIEYKNQQEQMQALDNEQIDAVLFDAASAGYWTANNNNLFKLVGPNIPSGYGYGIMTTNDNGALISKINLILENMEKDGSYLKIYSNYFGNMTPKT